MVFFIKLLKSNLFLAKWGCEPIHLRDTIFGTSYSPPVKQKSEPPILETFGTLLTTLTYSGSDRKTI